MILLIVEDENIIREGLLKITDWHKLGITTVVVADNGEAGIIMARRMRPDIIISDIRMPKMNGLEMADKIQQVHPACRFIFISAYSDKEYFKQAIRLKAVSFIEKPVNVNELEQVVNQAVSEIKIMKVQATEGHAMIRRELARSINRKINEDDDFSMAEAFARVGWEDILQHYPYITALCVKLNLDAMENGSAVWDSICEKIDNIEEALKFKYVSSAWEHDTLLIYVFSQSMLSVTTFGFMCDQIAQIIKETHRFHLAVGETYKNVEDIAQAFASVNASMQRAFFYPYGHVVMRSPEHIDIGKVQRLRDLKKKIILGLANLDLREVVAHLEEMLKYVQSSADKLPVGKVRECYFELITEVIRSAEAAHINLNLTCEPENEDWVSIVDGFNLQELHEFVMTCINRLFTGLRNRSAEKSQISAIRDYISRNYSDSNLSVKSISDHLGLSTSHICFMFKKETGMTVNQYITNFRLERAKTFLRESNCSVSEISGKVGYRDNSYFGRIFRKTEGVTPLEFREIKVK